MRRETPKCRAAPDLRWEIPLAGGVLSAVPKCWSDHPMRTVLVVDDVPDAREVVVRLLKRRGYQAVTAEDGYEALAAVNTQPPDLVLLDLTMPRLDGVAVLKALREDPRWKHLPVVLFTAVSDGRLVEEAGPPRRPGFFLKRGGGGGGAAHPRPH